MGISEETLASIRRGYQIWAESGGDDVGPLLDLMADDVEATMLPDGMAPLAFTKACHGKTDMIQYFHALVGDWCVLHAEIEEIVCERDMVVLLLNTAWRNRRTDKAFTSPAAHAWRFRNGFAHQIRLFFDSARWSAAAASAPD